MMRRPADEDSKADREDNKEDNEWPNRPITKTDKGDRNRQKSTTIKKERNKNKKRSSKPEKRMLTRKFEQPGPRAKYNDRRGRKRAELNSILDLELATERRPIWWCFRTETPNLSSKAVLQTLKFRMEPGEFGKKRVRRLRPSV